MAGELHDRQGKRQRTASALPSTLTTRLRFRTENLIGIADLARQGDGFRELSNTAAEICRAITGMPGCDWVTIAWLDADGGRLSTWGNSQVPPGFLAWAQSAERTRSGVRTPIFEAFTSGHEVVIPDITERRDFPQLIEAGQSHGWRAAAYIPIVARGRTIGTLNCYSRERMRYQRDDLDVLHLVARSAGIALETSMIADGVRTELNASRARTDELRRSEGDLCEQLSSLHSQLSELVATQSRLGQLPAELSADSVHAICEIVAERLKTSVMVWDLSGKPRAFAGDEKARARMAAVVGKRDPSRLSRLTDPILHGDTKMYRVGPERTAAVLALDPPPADTPLNTALVQHALALLAGELGLERAERSARDIARPALLHALVRGSMSPRQASAAGTMIDTTGHGCRVGIVRTPDDTSATAISYQLNLGARGKGCVAATAERDAVLVLLEDRPASELATTVKSLVDSLTTVVWAVGLSGAIQDLADAPRALHEASIACGMAEPRTVALYENLGATAPLLRRVDTPAASGFVTEMLGPLLEFDRSRKGSLVKTLACYLEHRGSLKHAAAELGVHENTVQLRLGRAAQLLKMDLHNPQQLGLLAVALSWHRMLGGSVLGTGTGAGAGAGTRRWCAPHI